MIHAKSLVTYWCSKGHKAETINDKLKGYFCATAPHIQEFLSGAEN
jgi:hypothetical protein